MRVKAWLSWILVFAAVLALAQTGGQGKGKEKSEPKAPPQVQQDMGRPDVTVVVREHSTSADLVEVTMANADYPPELLKQQLETLGRELGSAPRGLSVGVVKLAPNNPELQFVKATFAVNGLLDREGERLDLQPVLRAFAGAPEPHTIENLLIIFDGEKPGPRTVKSHDSESVAAEASFVPAPMEIEYHVRLKTQDPAKIEFPAQAPERTEQAKPSEQRSGTPAVFYVALAVGALALGALVYLALLRGGGSGRR